MGHRIFLTAGASQSPNNALLIISRPAIHLVFAGRTDHVQPPYEFVLIPAKHFRPWSLAQLFFLPHGGAVYDFNFGESRDQIATLQMIYNVERVPHAYIFWGETEDQVGVLAYKNCYCSEPTEPLHQPMSFAQRMEAMVPGYEEHYGRRMAAKARLLRHVRPLDSLAELEKQVDLLSSIVMDLIHRVVPDVERPAWWATFANVMATNDSTALKGRDSAIEDIAERKGEMRSLISAYGAERQG